MITFEVKGLVPPRVEGPPLDLGLQPMLLVRQECDADVRVAQAVGVLRRQVASLQEKSGSHTVLSSKSTRCCPNTHFSGGRKGFLLLSLLTMNGGDTFVNWAGKKTFCSFTLLSP